MAFGLAIVAAVAPWTGPRRWVLHESALWYHGAVGIGGLASAGVCLIGYGMIRYLPRGRRTAAVGLTATAGLQSTAALVEFWRTTSEREASLPGGFSMSFVYQYLVTATIALTVVVFRICRARPLSSAARRRFSLTSRPYLLAVVLCIAPQVVLVSDVFVFDSPAGEIVVLLLVGVVCWASAFVAAAALFATPPVLKEGALQLLLASSALALTTSVAGVARSIGPALIGPVPPEGGLYFWATLLTTATTVIFAVLARIDAGYRP